MTNAEAEIDVLNRILYMLEENAVVAVAKEDPKFGEFLKTLYTNVQNKVQDLESQAKRELAS